MVEFGRCLVAAQPHNRGWDTKPPARGQGKRPAEPLGGLTSGREVGQEGAGCEQHLWLMERRGEGLHGRI